MAIEFSGSPKPTIGVEIELQLIDPDTKDLAPASVQILEQCQKRGVERVKAEITQSMVEIDTEISMDIKECRRYLDARLGTLWSIADNLNVCLSVSGTHPFQRWTERKIYPSERYLYLLQKFQWLARRLTVYGVHVHVGVESGEKAIAISNAVIRYLPHLLALSASSPFWEGVDTGMQSCRAGIMESFPISGLPYYFPNWSEFETYAETLARSGAITSLKDLYWYVRPNPTFGTLEFRICDGMPTLTETMALAALIQCLVVWINDGLDKGTRSRQIRMQRYWIAPENQWIGARDGLEGSIILSEDGNRRKIGDDVLRMVERLEPVAKDLRCHEELLYLREIVKRGTSAGRQRAVYRERQNLHDVVDSLVKEFRTDSPMYGGGMTA